MAMAHGPAPRRTHLRRFRVEATTTSITNYMVGTRAAYMYLAVVDRQTRNRGFAIWLTLGVAPRPLGGRYYASMADAMRGCLNENCIRSRIPVLYVSVVTSDQSLHVVTLSSGVVRAEIGHRRQVLRGVRRARLREEPRTPTWLWTSAGKCNIINFGRFSLTSTERPATTKR